MNQNIRRHANGQQLGSNVRPLSQNQTKGGVGPKQRSYDEGGPNMPASLQVTNNIQIPGSQLKDANQVHNSRNNLNNFINTNSASNKTQGNRPVSQMDQPYGFNQKAQEMNTANARTGNQSKNQQYRDAMSNYSLGNIHADQVFNAKKASQFIPKSGGSNVGINIKERSSSAMAMQSNIQPNSGKQQNLQDMKSYSHFDYKSKIANQSNIRAISNKKGYNPSPVTINQKTINTSQNVAFSGGGRTFKNQSIYKNGNGKTSTINHSKSQLQVMNNAQSQSPHRQNDINGQSHFEQRNKTQSQLSNHPNVLKQMTGNFNHGSTMGNSQNGQQYQQLGGQGGPGQKSRNSGHSGQLPISNTDVIMDRRNKNHNKIYSGAQASSAYDYNQDKSQKFINRQNNNSQIQTPANNQNRTMKPSNINLQNIKRGTITTPGVNGPEVDDAGELQDGHRSRHNVSRKMLSSTNNQNLKSVNKDLKQSISMSGTQVVGNSANNQVQLTPQPGKIQKSEQKNSAVTTITPNTGDNGRQESTSVSGIKQKLLSNHNTNSNSFLPNIKSRNSAQVNVYGAQQKSHQPVLQNNQGNSYTGSLVQKQVQNQTMGSNDYQRGQGLHPMPTQTSIGTASTNSGQTIGPEFSQEAMLMLTNASQDNQGMLGQSPNAPFNQANGPELNQIIKSHEFNGQKASNPQRTLDHQNSQSNLNQNRMQHQDTQGNAIGNSQAGGPASINTQSFQDNSKDRPQGAPLSGQNSRQQMRSRNGLIQQQINSKTHGNTDVQTEKVPGRIQTQQQRTINERAASSKSNARRGVQGSSGAHRMNIKQSLPSEPSPNKTINQSQGSNLHHTSNNNYRNNNQLTNSTSALRAGARDQPHNKSTMPSQNGQQESNIKPVYYKVPANIGHELQVGQSSQLGVFQNSKTSNKRFGVVRSFAANTHVGLVRKANEDRIAIILNVIQPAAKLPKVTDEQWPKIQIFAVYDGHGGNQCAEYLKEHLHNQIIMQPDFPLNVNQAIMKGCQLCDDNYIHKVFTEYQATQKMQNCKSGSCANLVMTMNDDIYIINVGDSRAIGSKNNGAVAVDLSQDHKPSELSEFKRIESAGGHIYQTHSVIQNGTPCLQQIRVPKPPTDKYTMDNPLIGPFRVFPGRLSVCRTFGDLEAKKSQLGGNPNVVIPTPEINFQKDGCKKLDYVLTCSDGIFDKLSTQQVHDIIWTTINRHITDKKCNIHQIIGFAVDEVLHASARFNSLDNISVVMIAFEPMVKLIESMHQQ